MLLCGVIKKRRQVLSLKEALNAVLRENSTWRGQATLQDALFLPAPARPTKTPQALPRADVASLSTQLSELLAAPPMLSLTEKHGVKEWETKWALRGEKLSNMQRRLATGKAAAATGSKS